MAGMAARSPLLLISLILLLPTIRADLGVRFSNVFGSHMVLQRNKPVPIWGYTYPGVTVTVTFAGKNYTTVSSASNLWKVELPPQKATRVGSTITATSSANTVALTDVLFGDVILCSGQSKYVQSYNSTT